MTASRGPNLTLVGMPGSGKSTVGRLTALALGWKFIDIDAAIECEAGMKLWEINQTEGFEGLGRRESAASLSLAPAEPTVIAPGGSVVYSEPAMKHLWSLGSVYYLHVPPEVLESRAGDLRMRGVVIRPGMSYEALIRERDPLYRQWADVVIECGPEPADVIADRVAARVRGR